MTERLHFDFSLSCIGEGHGNPLQCSCLENPRDGGAWWAALYGVAQSQTQLKRLSSSSRRHQFSLWVGKIPWRGEWLPPPVFLPGESHGQRSLAGYSPWDCKESNMTGRLIRTCACAHTHTHTHMLISVQIKYLKFLFFYLNIFYFRTT